VRSIKPGAHVSGRDATAVAAELAERILDEVSGVNQDWRKISAWARELAATADAAAQAPEGGEGDG
jgi:hypothetical protein